MNETLLVSADLFYKIASAEDLQEHMKTLADGSRPYFVGSTAVIPLRGGVSESDYWGAHLPSFRAAFAAAEANDRVERIVLDINSPGGTVPGVSQTANMVAASSKETAAVSNHLAASAAYWIGSQADQFTVAPAGHTGSIGAYRLHMDISGMLEKEGLKPSFLAIPDGKVEGNPFEPLSEEARAFEMAQVQEVYDEFAEAVQSGRGFPVEGFEEASGGGRVFTARQAVRMGLADSVSGLSEVVNSGVGRGPIDAKISQELCEAWDSCDEFILHRRQAQRARALRLRDIQ